MPIIFDDDEIKAGLMRLARAGEDLRPVMREIAAAMEAGAERAFQEKKAPDGKRWQPLSEETTIPRRREQGKWPGQILQVSGGLAGSITSDSDALSAYAGTNKIYAPTHQFGARKGQYGRTKRGGPIPWGDIPARPFLGVSSETRAEILDLLREHFRR